MACGNEVSEFRGEASKTPDHTSTAYQFRMNCLAALLTMLDGKCNVFVDVPSSQVAQRLVELSRSFTSRNPPIRLNNWIKKHKHGLLYEAMGINKVSWSVLFFFET